MEGTFLPSDLGEYNFGMLVRYEIAIENGHLLVSTKVRGVRMRQVVRNQIFRDGVRDSVCVCASCALLAKPVVAPSPLPWI